MSPSVAISYTASPIGCGRRPDPYREHRSGVPPALPGSGCRKSSPGQQVNTGQRPRSKPDRVSKRAGRVSTLRASIPNAWWRISFEDRSTGEDGPRRAKGKTVTVPGHSRAHSRELVGGSAGQDALRLRSSRHAPLATVGRAGSEELSRHATFSGNSNPVRGLRPRAVRKECG